MSGSLIPNSTELAELTRIFKQIQSELKSLRSAQQSSHAVAQQALEANTSTLAEVRKQSSASAAQSFQSASPDSITMIVSSIPPA